MSRLDVRSGPADPAPRTAVSSCPPAPPSFDVPNGSSGKSPPSRDESSAAVAASTAARMTSFFFTSVSLTDPASSAVPMASTRSSVAASCAPSCGLYLRSASAGSPPSFGAESPVRLGSRDSSDSSATVTMLTVSGYALPNSQRSPSVASVAAACMRILKFRVSRSSISNMRTTSGDHALSPAAVLGLRNKLAMAWQAFH
mmetsp:Transcript_12378/g.57249  ORF Transcript_12378/g.57249 Transcript_12378/m.57249 type:complete len:200 (-) Transcript_12378:2931-3530(-)